MVVARVCICLSITTASKMFLFFLLFGELISCFSFRFVLSFREFFFSLCFQMAAVVVVVAVVVLSQPSVLNGRF